MDRVFVGMEGIVVDFDAFRGFSRQTDDEAKHRTGAYVDAQPVLGAIEALHRTVEMGYDVFLTATPPEDASAEVYGDHAAWVSRQLPDFRKKLIITSDKGLLGDVGDVLLDAQPQVANGEKFPGAILRFVGGYHWQQALQELARRSPAHHSGVVPLIGVGDHQQALLNLRAMTPAIEGLQAKIVQAEFGVGHRGQRAWSGVEVRLHNGDVLTIMDKATCEDGIIIDREGAISPSIWATLRAIEHANEITGGSDRGDVQLLSELFAVQLERVQDVVGAIWHAVHSLEGDPSARSWTVRPESA